jgi:hypothetical protein
MRNAPSFHHVRSDPLHRDLIRQDPRHGLHRTVRRGVRRVPGQERVPMMEDDNVTMRPPLLAGMRFAASRHTRNVPRTFTMNMASKSSMIVSASLGYLRFRIPAHAGHHDVRQGPNASSARLKSARTASGSDTSALTATARWPRVASSATCSSALAGLDT